MPTYCVALVMIAKNEARSIKRCLQSVAPFVDAMLVLDTGSTDNTVDIAISCGAIVKHFTWCDDFATARNAALSHSTADWNIILDADEWLSSGAETLQQLRQTTANFVGTIEIVSGFVAGNNKQYARSITSRVLPKGVSYRGTIHEQPQHKLPLKALAISVQHDGYEPAQQQEKKQRNMQLLQQALLAQPGDRYLQYKLGVEYEQAGKLVQAQVYFEQALVASSSGLSWRLDLVIRLLFIYKKLKLFTQGLTLAAQEQALSHLSADYSFSLGDFYLDVAINQPQRTAELIPKIEQCWLKCLEIGEVTGVNGAVFGRGSYLAAHNLAVFYQSLGKTAQSQHYFKLASSH
ncbi:hypothetical protein VT06_13040 [Arsukibacterium sp. MJ3]|uniref:glycosyltransferase family 2 protein n=1 Tax=Arsukibacterium sp. MJ3 TaxID=1632859 RepID=UPI0006273206|nr:glycosyltransferase family 2 protein [Arsukibacterium sp. MJ3]KKO48163.1 hypothetical protein VT06_13040 [Arsukibacterium sp. MJ3]